MITYRLESSEILKILLLLSQAVAKEDERDGHSRVFELQWPYISGTF